LNSKTARRGFSQDELAQMYRINKGTFSGDAARFLGNLGGGGGGIGAFVTGTVTKGVAPVLGYGFKKLGNAITAREVARLDEMVRSRSPLGQRLAKPLEDWSTAAQEFETSPVARNVARLTLASKNLSNNLADVGIQVPADKLASAGGGSSEDEQVNDYIANRYGRRE
jgi:hypothetical protein